MNWHTVDYNWRVIFVWISIIDHLSKGSLRVVSDEKGAGFYQGKKSAKRGIFVDTFWVVLDRYGSYLGHFGLFGSLWGILQPENSPKQETHLLNRRLVGDRRYPSLWFSRFLFWSSCYSISVGTINACDKNIV